MIEILGIDLGYTILDNPNKKEFPESFRVIRRLAAERFGNRIYIVSKVTPEQEVRARNWIESPSFQKGTGIPIKRAHFCQERREKGTICAQLGITHFIDDRPEVMNFMPESVIHRILFRPRSEDLEQFAHIISNMDKANSWLDIEQMLLDKN